MAKACVYLCHQCITLVASVNSVKKGTFSETSARRSPCPVFIHVVAPACYVSCSLILKRPAHVQAHCEDICTVTYFPKRNQA